MKAILIAILLSLVAAPCFAETNEEWLERINRECKTARDAAIAAARARIEETHRKRQAEIRARMAEAEALLARAQQQATQREADEIIDMLYLIEMRKQTRAIEALQYDISQSVRTPGEEARRTLRGSR